PPFRSQSKRGAHGASYAIQASVLIIDIVTQQFTQPGLLQNALSAAAPLVIISTAGTVFSISAAGLVVNFVVFVVQAGLAHKHLVEAGQGLMRRIFPPEFRAVNRKKFVMMIGNFC